MTQTLYAEDTPFPKPGLLSSLGGFPSLPDPDDALRSPGISVLTAARDVLVEALEQVRKWYGFYVVGYVLLSEHVHLLQSEPARRHVVLSFLT